MTKVQEYFNNKYDRKNSPAYLQGVLRTIDKLPPEHDEAEWEQEKEVVEK